MWTWPHNHPAQHILIEADRGTPWTRKGLSQVTATARDELYILVWTPSKQIVFSLSQDADAGDFCDQLEITTGRHIRDRNTWPDLELDAEPLTGWDALKSSANGRNCFAAVIMVSMGKFLKFAC